MGCIVVPFPSRRRQAFVRRHADRMAQLSPAAAERHLAWQVRVQIEALKRRGISGDLIDREQRELEAAIRSALCRSVATRGGAA